MSDEVINGTVWRKPWPSCHEVVIVFVGCDQYGILHVCGHMDAALTAPLFEHDATSKWLFTRDEILRKMANWERIDARLEIVAGRRDGPGDSETH
jgi:hypothetical protein